MTKNDPQSVHELIEKWTRESSVNLDWLTKLELLQLLDEELFCQYQPHRESPGYFERLSRWLNNVSRNSDKKLLFELASLLLFIGSEEMLTLYRSSFRDSITRWVIDQAKIDITSTSAAEQIQLAFKETFFGSIAGMDVGTFCRVNQIRQDIRPDFREQSLIGDPKSFAKYLGVNNFKRIIAVEDYVGSGSQMKSAATYLSKLKKHRILLCPMIVSPKGVEVGNGLATGHVSFSPNFCIPQASSISRTKNRSVTEPAIFERFRKMLERTYSKVKGNSQEQEPYGPFGFPPTKGTGSLLLTYLNCPNNVPPAIHHSSESWEPLFQRSSREG